VVAAEILPAADGRHRLSTDPFGFSLGVDLEDLLRDPLPAAAEHPRVIDQDRDGNPGVTVEVGWIRVYLACRLALALDGQLTAPAPGDALAEDDPRRPAASGRLSLITLDQTIYDDNIPFVSVAQVAADADAGSEVLREDHTFDLVPAPPAASCDTLRRLGAW
jgi:hypothetical protein